MRGVAEKYQLIQLGLCFFVLDTEKSAPGTHYSAYPFNIYVFPEERPGSRNEIVFDIDTANFHKQQKLDFNKWIYEGVPYVTLKAERIMTARALEDRVEDTEELKLTEDDAKRTAQVLEGVKKWIQEGAKGEYVLADLNPFLRKFMYQKLAELFPAVYTESRQVGRFEKHIVLKVITEEEKKAIKEAKRQEELKEIHRKTGVLRLFKILTNLKAPIIGHNPTFDLLFIYSNLYEDLPYSLAEFKTQINNLFPTIYDTMLVFSDEKVKKLLPVKQSSALEAVYQFLSKSTEMSSVSIDVGLPNKYSENGHYHEAGYDSYITGYCFAKMMGYIGKEEFEKYKNFLYAHRSPFNINLTGKEALHENVNSSSKHQTVIYVGRLAEGKAIESIGERVKEYKELYYYKVVEMDTIFFVIKRIEYLDYQQPPYRGHEKLIEALKSMPDLIILKEWKEYVEERKNRMETEDKKEKDYRSDRRWHNKGRKLPSPEKPTPIQPRPKIGEAVEKPTLPPPPPAPHQTYPMQYGANQPQMYPYYVPASMPQSYTSYQYYYGTYPRPPYQ
eukprot:TRINITY_DN200_c0_g2_i1.p4 TRINITY_DN200_c0_g2~~TRINITY_DN200_c0_g2_i1.p4  ORF type:complete len:557 (-),score=78.62 TRINITY_DN200_c0_g2_i1:65-1735(-)